LQRRIILWAGTLALLAGTASGEVVTLQGEVGEDTAPYQFIPSVPRGFDDNLWAFTDPENLHSFETFLHFELPAEWMCSNVGVSEAQLWILWVTDDTSQGSGSEVDGTLECREVLEAWSEGTLTWTNKPDTGDPVDVVTDLDDPIIDVKCDVTELVADWVACERPNYGFAITNPTDRLMGFFSFDAPVDPLLQPALIVTLPEPGVGGAYVAVAGLGVLARWRGRRQRRAARSRRA
jgi:hypothetical protein